MRLPCLAFASPDVANCYLPAVRPRSYLAPAGFGTLGPAVPMALGAKVAAPQRPVVCLVGDGGLLFTVAELATAAAHAVEYVGLPEAQLNLAQAVTYLASAPKSNASYLGFKRALADVETARTRPAPTAY